MTNETREMIMAVAGNYADDEYQLFVDEYGWADWMEEFTEAADGEPATEAEIKAIDTVLKECWDSVHEAAM